MCAGLAVALGDNPSATTQTRGWLFPKRQQQLSVNERFLSTLSSLSRETAASSGSVTGAWVNRVTDKAGSRAYAPGGPHNTDAA